VKRLVWLGVGAAVGIVAYRKGTELMAQAKAQGVVVTTTQVVASSKAALDQAQQLLARSIGGEQRGLG
jgi:hypothetical protein